MVKRSLNLLLAGLFSVLLCSAQDKTKLEYYEIRLYHFTSREQEALLDQYLEQAFLPGLHRMDIRSIGVFKPITNDTAADKKIYLLIPAVSLEKLSALPALLMQDSVYTKAAQPYLEADYNRPPFTRMENIFLRAFPLAPRMVIPGLQNAKTQRIYELRSYESATEKLYNSKVDMFNHGGEIALFKRLGFNAVFYADVVSGSRMPNLMYMTSFENKAERDAHWKTFGSDPEWKRLSALPEYQHTVSKADIILMKATSYSGF